VLDPSLMPGQQIGVSPHDLAAFKAIGWLIKSSMVPIVNGFLALNQSERTVRVLGWYIQEHATCRFNGDSNLTTEVVDTPAKFNWRGITCPIPTSLAIGAQNITVAVSNDGETYSESVQFSQDTFTVKGVNTSNIALVKYEGSVQVSGSSFTMDARYPSKCSVGGLSFPSEVTGSQTLVCKFKFSSGNPPVQRQLYNLTVTRGTMTSKPLSVYFTYPPNIVAGRMDGRKIRLSGDNFENGSVCQFPEGDTKPASKKGLNGLVCDSIAVTSATLDVRVSSTNGWSNWFTVKVRP